MQVQVHASEVVCLFCQWQGIDSWEHKAILQVPEECWFLSVRNPSIAQFEFIFRYISCLGPNRHQALKRKVLDQQDDWHMAALLQSWDPRVERESQLLKVVL